MKRYDYRNDYRGMTITQLLDVMKTLIDRMLDAVSTGDSGSMDDCIKRISYVDERIKKIKNKEMTHEQN